jgi:DNA-binding CsgD family transcriptional regulator
MSNILDISSRQREKDDRLLDLLYAAACQVGDNGWATFLDELVQCYGHSLVSFLNYDASNHNSSVTLTGATPSGFVANYDRHYGLINPFLPYSRRRPAGTALFSESYLSFADLSKTEYYQDYLRPEGFDSSVSVTIQKSESRSVGLSILIPRSTYYEDTETLGRLQRLTPHLLRATQLRRQLFNLDARASAAEAGLKRLATAMFLVDANGRVSSQNALAERMAESADGLSMKQNTLRASHPQDNTALYCLINCAAQASRDIMVKPGGVMQIRRLSGRAPYEVLVAPASRAAFSLGSDERFVMIFVRDPETRTSSSIDWLQRLYALTGAEARLMQGLLSGHTLDEIAVLRGVSKDTLRTSLKIVFRKTGTASQSQLIQMGLRGIALLHQE